MSGSGDDIIRTGAGNDIISAGATTGSTMISFDSNGSAAGGTVGVLVTMAGVGFSTESAAVTTFADNILV